MNDADMIRIARELQLKNRRNKAQIARKRAKFASTKAKLESIQHPGKFPTRYKYG